MSGIKVNFVRKPKKLEPKNLKEFDPLPVPKKIVPKFNNNNEDESDKLFNEEPEELMPVNFSIPADAVESNHLDVEKDIVSEKNDDNYDLLTDDIDAITINDELTTDLNPKKEKVKSSVSKRFLDALVNDYNLPPVIPSLQRKNQQEDEAEELEEASGEIPSEKMIQNWKELGTSYAVKEDYSKALNVFDKILYFDPMNYLVFECKAQIYLELGMYNLGLKAIDACIKINSCWYVGCLTLARIQRELGEFQLSYCNYEKCKVLCGKVGLTSSNGKPSSAAVENVDMSLFLREIMTEMGELQELIDQQNQKQLSLLNNLNVSSTANNESVDEVNRCFYHLSFRARSRSQLDFLSKQHEM
jgi:tetratricopeptide (TPR) repeat protein